MSGSRSLRTGIRSLRSAAFGADPVGERLRRIQASPNFSAGSFRNAQVTRSGPTGSTGALLKRYLNKAERVRRAPAGAVPLYGSAAAELIAPPASGLRLTWTGHSSVLAEIDGGRVLFDPVWGERCSPFGFIGPRRLHPVPLPLVDLGPVDVVVISHDHYDHLDMPTIKKLAGTRTVFAVPLGVGAHLERWGVPADRIHELDWHEQTRIAGLTFTATPARHFCGRGVRNPQHALWASWVVRGGEHRVFHSGDTGYFDGFADIGAEHGPFDATMIQVGAYSEFWPDVHMTPEQGVRSHLDLQGGRPEGRLLPIHWATFNLAPHPWAEPGEGMVAAAGGAGVRLALPRPGQPFEPDSDRVPELPWWRAVAVGATPDTGTADTGTAETGASDGGGEVRAEHLAH
ncbi:MBL fold metallo-hydrolase [Streptomyces sp. NA04227]|uniref:MBL fold metallo-hydrolase n=1 Tax=Streptomyces sp. NA04227 TaxID=2742136 RepID=UPI001590E57E|nr:MBL fold metallo-hydrolase [Streptomyces sp. NA04227]QKW10250.1 MBL fold metallo-hydrolase [Streptomyces sp. NA04227]